MFLRRQSVVGRLLRDIVQLRVLSASDPKRTFLLRAIRKRRLPVIGWRGYLLPALRTATPPCCAVGGQLLEGIGVFGGVLEPSQEVEWLSKFSAVMQTSRYGRQVFHTNSNVVRLLLEDGSAFILR